jgi:NAD(P)H-flavin reductase
MHSTNTTSPKVEFLYSTKPPLTDKHNIKPSSILFLSRLTEVASKRPDQVECTVFLTNQKYKKIKDPQALGWFHDRRIKEADLLHALGADLDVRRRTLCYVCGPPKMTDDIVSWFAQQEGLSTERVLCEKWW